MRKTIFLTLIGGLLAFTAGIVTVQSWSTPIKPTPPRIDVPQQPPPPAPVITPDPEPSEIVFANGRLRIVAEEVQLKSERLHYDIKARYPQIDGSNALYIKKLNQRIRQIAINRYHWMLNPSKEDLRRYKYYPATFNEGFLDYEIVAATGSIVSICFTSYDYGIGAAHTAITSHVINYDLKARRELKLGDLFKPNSKYLEFIARYCTEELKLSEPIVPKAETFASWNLTDAGVQFNFDPCVLYGCSAPPQEVTIPFSALTPFLKPFKVV